MPWWFVFEDNLKPIGTKKATFGHAQNNSIWTPKMCMHI